MKLNMINNYTVQVIVTGKGPQRTVQAEKTIKFNRNLLAYINLDELIRTIKTMVYQNLDNLYYAEEENKEDES